MFVPKEIVIKRLFSDETVVRPTECIIGTDLAAFELRAWAQVCLWRVGYSDLAEILNDTHKYEEYGGVLRCPHVEMGARLKGLSMVDAYGLAKTNKTAYKDMRNLAKGPNFGLPGGMGATRLADYCRLGYGVPILPDKPSVDSKGNVLPSGKKIIQTWKGLYREADRYLRGISRETQAGGGTCSFVNYQSGRIRGGVGYCDGANGFFQALAAHAATAAGWALMEEMFEKRSSPLFGCRMLAFVHDEYLVSAPYERKHEAAFRMRDVMVSVVQSLIPDVKIDAEPAAMFRWDKAAGDPVFDKAGKLVCWEERLAA